MKTQQVVKMLEDLLKEWRKREKEYFAGMLNAEAKDKPRYEGIHTGTRWCREDIHTILDQINH